MEFKITKRTRIKIPAGVLLELKKHTSYEYMFEFRKAFQLESGLQMTSSHYSRFKRQNVYYFQVLDKSKYFLAKIKYGI